MRTTTPMNFMLGFGAGYITAHYLDRDRGRYRRALVRDKMIHLGHRARRNANVTARDIAHRTRGTAAVIRSRLFPHEVDDDVLTARVASKLGRIVSNPHAIGVTADGCRVVLTGLAFEDEVPHLIGAIRRIPGVEGIDNRLETHGRGENVPGLQNHDVKYGQPIDLFQRRWSPATRFLVGITGGIAGATGVAALTRNKAA